MTPKLIFNTEYMTQNNIFSDFDCIEEVNTVNLLSKYNISISYCNINNLYYK